MGFAAMKRWSALVLDPMALFIVFAGRGDDAASTSVPIFTWIASWRVISADNRVTNLKGLSKTDESGFAQVSALTPRTRRTVGTILHMAADAEIPLSAIVAQHRVPVAQSSRLESYPAGVAPCWRT